MVACIAAGLAAGTFLDNQLGTGPVLAVVLMLASVGGGMVVVYRIVMRTVRKRQRGPREPEN
jgi:F0F1-type ATP synthase assembly protein I